jgi:hypothetical protein
MDFKGIMMTLWISKYYLQVTFWCNECSAAGKVIGYMIG